MFSHMTCVFMFYLDAVRVHETSVGVFYRTLSKVTILTTSIKAVTIY